MNRKPVGRPASWPRVTVPEMLAAQAQRTPGATAIRCRDMRVSYRQLEVRANQLARHLISLGAGPEDLVAVVLPRTPDLVVAVLAVLKTGAAYVPIDPGYPADRIAHLFQDAAPVSCVTTVDLADRLPTEKSVQLDQPSTAGMLQHEDGGPVTDSDRLGVLLPGHPAYVIYTSASTGAPKGVVIEHRSLAHYLSWAAKDYPSAGGTALVLSSVAFDLTVTGLYATLLRGGTVWLADLGGDEPVSQCLPGCTFLKATPSHLALLSAIAESCAPTEELVLGGEALSGEWIADWRASHPGVAVVNAYGPTEATVTSTQFRVPAGTPIPAGPVPIGRPLGDVRVYVLDTGLQLCPAGVIGELYIAGPGVARCYLNRPSLTAERFVADPFGFPGERMYRSGDLARWNASGELVFTGRADDQVKLRGFRIELPEIESVLAAHPGVSHAAVIVQEDAHGDKRLVGYALLAQSATAGPAELRRHVAEYLPDYMVPDAMVILGTMPLTPNGKVDRQALPPPEYQTTPAGRAPRTAQEEILAGLFAEFLGVTAVTIDDNFFDLGGDSLLAARLVGRVRSALGLELGLRAMFELPTVAGLAGLLYHAKDARSPIESRRRPTELPLSLAQRRLWFLNQLEGGPNYNIPYAARITGALDVAALQAALGDVSDRHESLRMVFPDTDGRPRHQVLHGPGSVPVLNVLDSNEHDIADRLSAAAWRGFNLATDLPVRAWLFVMSGQEYVFLMVVHHIVHDAWSRRLLLRDLAEAYAARRRGAAPGWTPLPVQYADYALWQRELLGAENDPGSVLATQLAYWQATLAGLPEQLSLPVTLPRSSVLAAAAEGRLTFEVAPGLRKRLVGLAQENQVTLFMVLQAALAVVFTQLGSGTDIPLGTSVAGRGDDALDEMVGFFINTLVLRTNTSGDPTFRELLARVRQTDLAAYAHQDVPFDLVVRALNPLRVAGANPLFQVMMVLRDNAGTTFNLPGVQVDEEDIGSVGMATFDLSFSFSNDLKGTIGYSPMFKHSTVEVIAQYLIWTLREMAADMNTRIGQLTYLPSLL